MWNSFLIVLIALLLSGNPIFGQSASFDPEIRKLYLNLDSPGGNKLLFQRYPANSPEFVRLVAYREFLHQLLYQSKTNWEIFSRQSGEWLQLLEKSKNLQNFNPAAIAEIRLYRAILAGQFSDYKTAAIELVASYKVVARSGPGFVRADLNKLSGILGVLFQQIPDQYVKYLRIMGVRPSGLSGFNGLERYYTAALPGSTERMEGYLLMVTALKEFWQDPAASWDFVKTEGKPLTDNKLIAYQSALAALKAGDNESAIKILDSGVKGDVTDVFPYWYYQLGRCKLYRNDPDAPVYLEKFLSDPGGDNYRHIATLMEGWYYQVHDQKDRAKECFLRVRNFPAPYSGYDRQALNEAGADKMPDPELLKARLLFDGGYYDPCLILCQQISRSDKYSPSEKVELLYRKARCEQRLGRIPLSILSFLGVVEQADRIANYIVPNSALQLGYLYKKTGQNELARKYFQLSLDLNKYGYREGINRQAQAALRELGK